MTAVVDARFTGSPIVVDTTEFLERRLVTVTIAGTAHVLFPHEARRLATVLLDAATEAAP